MLSKTISFKKWLEEVYSGLGLKNGSDRTIQNLAFSEDVVQSFQFEFKNGVTPVEASSQYISEQRGNSEPVDVQPLNLNYVAPAKDFQFHLQNNDSVTQALKSYSEMLRRDAGILDKLTNIIEGLPDQDRKKIKIQCSRDGVQVQVKAPSTIMRLIQKLGLTLNNTL